MASFEQANKTALELDDLIVEIGEALRYVRSLERIKCKNSALEHAISRRMAIGCIRRIHQEMHNPFDANHYPHRYGHECRTELINRVQALRYTEVRALMRFARESHRAYIPIHHWLDFEEDRVGRGPNKTDNMVKIANDN